MALKQLFDETLLRKISPRQQIAANWSALVFNCSDQTESIGKVANVNWITVPTNPVDSFRLWLIVERPSKQRPNVTVTSGPNTSVSRYGRFGMATIVRPLPDISYHVEEAKAVRLE